MIVVVLLICLVMVWICIFVSILFDVMCCFVGLESEILVLVINVLIGVNVVVFICEMSCVSELRLYELIFCDRCCMFFFNVSVFVCNVWRLLVRSLRSVFL